MPWCWCASPSREADPKPPSLVKPETPHAAKPWHSFSVLLMPVLAASFVAQQLLIVPKSYHAYLFLSGYGMKSGQLWEIFTCQLFHSSPSLAFGLGHLLLNLAGLWFVGQKVEAHLGHSRFLLLYCGAGLAGAVAQGLVAVTGFLLPESLATTADFLIARFGESVGSSIGLCGVFAVYCLWQGHTKIALLWFIPIQAVRLLWLALAIAALLLVIPSDPSVAHVGHFVGLLAGMLFYKLWQRPSASSAAS
jgi:membrane associated rhomboid family serine protease